MYVCYAQKNRPASLVSRIEGRQSTDVSSSNGEYRSTFDDSGQQPGYCDLAADVEHSTMEQAHDDRAAEEPGR